MSEQDMRQRVNEALRGLDPISVENPAYPGTPDVNFIEGWLELKWLRDWPAKRETPVLIEHFTQQQRVWLLRRWRRGGKVYLLLQVKKTWLLFSGETAALHVGRVSRDELEHLACLKFENGLRDKELRDYLCTPEI